MLLVLYMLLLLLLLAARLLLLMVKEEFKSSNGVDILLVEELLNGEWIREGVSAKRFVRSLW